MKFSAHALPLILFTASLVFAQARPRPPGVHQADQAEAQTEKNIPPPIMPRTRLDLTKVRREADDLARIAQTIPPDVASIQKGLLPKDITDKLKQIEKLSKQLRKELNQ